MRVTLPKRDTDRPTARRVRTPTVIQMEATECGAASLGIVLAHYGRHVPLEELRQACGVSRDGSTAASVAKAARRYGLTARGRQSPVADLGSVRLPAILYWNFEHFLVLEGLGRKVRLNDPATGPRTVSWEEFDDAYTGILIAVEPGPAFERGGHPFSLVRTLRERWRNLGSVVPQTAILGLLVALVGIAVPALTRVFVDRVLLGSESATSVALVAAMAVATVITLVAGWLQQRLLVRAETAVALGSAARLMRHMLRLPLGFFNQRMAADLARRVRTNDLVADIFTRRLASTAVDMALALSYAALLCQYDLVLGLCALVFSGLNVVVLRWLSTIRATAIAGLQAERGRLFAAVYTTISMIETVKASGQEELSYQQFAARQAAVTTGQQKAGVPAAVVAAVPALLAALNTAVLIALGSHLVLTGTLTVGVLVAMQGLAVAMNRPVTSLTTVSAQVEEIGADLQRLQDVERYPLPPAPAVSGTPTPLEGHVVLDRVTFGYNPLVPPLLQDFSLVLPPGRGWHWSAAPAAGSPPSAGCSPDCTSPGAGGSPSTAASRRRSTRGCGPPPWRWSTRTRSCSRARSGTTSPCGTRPSPTRTSYRPSRTRASTRRWRPAPAVWPARCTKADATSPEVSANAWRSPAPWSATPGCSSWTRPPAPWTPRRSE